MKKLKDYLHFHLGCYIRIREYSNYGETVFIEKLISCSDEHAGTERFEFYFDDDNEISFQPILRPLSDITEEEATTIYEELFPGVDHDQETKVFYVKSYCSKEGLYYKGTLSILEDARYMVVCLRYGFDLFGLIEAGLAIDSTTLKEKA